MTGGGEFIEVQGSAEGAPFSRKTLDAMLAMGETACNHIFEALKAALGVK
jgi:ribonuclease PH